MNTFIVIALSMIILLLMLAVMYLHDLYKSHWVQHEYLIEAVEELKNATER